MAEPTLAELLAPFREFRRDGWPRCPRCGEDELGCVAYPTTLEDCDADTADPAGQLERRLRAGLLCYRCGWRGP